MSSRHAERDLFAPGKLFILGEWAVLEGAPALLAPTDAGQRARLEITPGQAFAWDAPEHHDAPRRWGWDGVRWREHTQAPDPLDLLGATLTEAALAGFAPQAALTARVAAEGLQSTAPDGRRVKLGLGSSAAACALAVRALAAVHAAPREEDAQLRLALDAHRRAQAGRGSGADVAVALLDADVRFQLEAPAGLGAHMGTHLPTPRAARVQRPQHLHLLAAWTGQPADTRLLLDAVDAWRRAATSQWRDAIGAVARIAAGGADAWAAHDLDALLDAAREAARALDALGRAARAPLVIDAHRRIEAVVHATCPRRAVAKPSGAGGGDMAMILLRDPQDAHEVQHALQRAGFLVLPLTPRTFSDHLPPDAPTLARP